MNKIKITTAICAAKLISTLFMVSAANAYATDLFVATNGVDNITTNNGSISQPWASLDFALDQVAAGDTINIRTGSYREAITQAGVSGTAAQPITIQAYNGEQVTFDGTVPVTGSWTQHSGSIYKLQLAEPVWQLFVDDELMVNARWPNARFDDGSMFSHSGWAKGLDATTTNGHFDTDPAVHDLAAENIDVTDAVIIANTRHFETYTRKVTSHTAGSNAFDHGLVPFFSGSKSYYYLQGKLNLLDQDKEWHIDAVSHMAYLWVPGGGAPTGNIRGRNQKFAIDASNWNYVTFKGLNFFATNIELTSSESITIEDCNFNYGGASKRALGETATQSSALRLTNEVGAGNFVMRNTTITNSDSQALWIKGENSIVENSLFENIDWSATERIAPGSNLVFKGANTLFSRNTIRNAGASESVATAVQVTNSNITAEYNHLYNNGYAQNDGALIQIRIEAQDGTVVHHNWLLDAEKYGFRFDAPVVAQSWGDNGYSHHNVVMNTRGANPKGDNDRHYNNLLFDNEDVDLIVLNEQAANGDWSNEFTKTINNAADSISGHRVNLVAVPGVVSSNFNGVNETQTLKTLLRDPANHDFRPVPGSSLVDAGEVISDADFSHPTQGAAADIGTYEDGNNNYWIPGRQLSAASYPIPFNAGSTTKTNADLMWRHGYTATSYNVYFGTTSGSLTSQGNQTNNIFDPGALTVGQTYYWRIDAITPTGTIAGDEWSFLVDDAAVSTSLNPIADTYVDDNLPDTNKGNDSVIRLVTPVTPGGAYQQRFGFLKFDVDVPGTITSATLKLYNPLGSNNKKVNVHTVADTSWGEALITWNNQPIMGASLHELDIAANSWQEFDVLSAVSSNGLLSFGLKRAPLDSRRELASKESAFAPQLIIEYVPAGGASPSNDAPVFTADPFSKTNATEDAAYSASIASDATDANSDPLTFSLVSGPAWLIISVDGSLTGTPDVSDIGLNTFTVEVSDGNGGSDTATLNITVDAAAIANNAPLFTANPFSKANATEDVAYSASIAADATDADSDPLTFSKISGPAWLSVAANGALIGMPATGDVGANAFIVQVDDGNGGSDTATLNITVDAAAIANNAPVFSADPIIKENATEGVAYSGSIASDASDADSDPLTFSKISGPAWLSVAANGALIGMPAAGDVGDNVFTVQVDDSNGGTDIATLNITVDAAAAAIITTLFSDDIEGGLSAWTIVGTVVSSNGAAYSGSKGARIKNSSLIRTNIDTTGYNNITLSYDRRTKNFESGEELLVEWYDGSNWNTVEQTDDTSWAAKSFVLPAGADDNANVKIRFKTTANANNERGDVDNVLVTGTTI